MIDKFKIVFDTLKLEEDDADDDALILEVSDLATELEEIDELRRLSIAPSEPEVESYAVT